MSENKEVVDFYIKTALQFIEGYAHKDKVVGAIITGSRISFSSNKYSDLDVYLVFDKKFKHYERGNKFVNGLEIEYFANPVSRILEYYESDFISSKPITQNMFLTGIIVFEKDKIISDLKQKALEYKERDLVFDEKTRITYRYFIYDALMDLKGFYTENKPEFHFYFPILIDKAIFYYLKLCNTPVNYKYYTKLITSEKIRKANYTRKIKNIKIRNLIPKIVLETDIQKQYELLINLEKYINDEFGLLDINNLVLENYLRKSGIKL